jgi:predicted component of type VI protein secretion system
VKLTLVFVNGEHAGRTVRVKRSKLSIGRAADCDLRSSSSRISRHHCVILVEPERVAVRDLDSRNGTFVNGEKIEAERTLSDGDRLTVGRLELEVQIAADTTSTKGSSPRPAAESQPAPKKPAAAGLSPRPSAKSQRAPKTPATADSSPQPAAKSSPPPKAPEEPTSISGLALSMMDAPGQDSRLTRRPAKPRRAAVPTDDEPTQSVAPSKSPPAPAPPEQPEAADPDAQSGDPAEYVVSEDEKEKARTTRPIVGVSKTAQGKRATGTSHSAAADALKKLFR